MYGKQFGKYKNIRIIKSSFNCFLIIVISFIKRLLQMPAKLQR